MELQPQALVGAWHLRSWSIAYSDRRGETFPFGEDALGLLVYTADGWMSACISRAERESLPEDRAFRSIDPKLQSAAFTSYFHYAGRYRFDGGSVIHEVTQSLNPNFVGSEQRREVDLRGDSLQLSGRDRAGGVERLHTLSWHRHSPG